MLIYHKSKDVVKCTSICMGASKTDVTTSNFIWDKHRHATDRLENDGDVFVTGGSYVGAVYEGKFEPRAMFSHYLGEEKWK